MSRIQFVGNALFIPFFLISVGMLVDVSVLGSLEVWYTALLFTGIVVFGKLIAAFTSKFIFKLSNAEGLTILGLSVPQAAATLAVTLIGFDVGLFDELAVNAVVIMILITCLIGPYLVEKFGRQIAEAESRKQYTKSDAPQRILVPLANPTTAEALMDIAFAVRDENSSESVFPLTVVRDGSNVEAQVADSEKMLSHAVIYATAAEIPVSPVTRVDMNIANGINRAIKEKRITSVIIGWNGESSARQRIFGGVLDQLLEQTDEMIMVSKIEEKISTNEHVILAVPPFASLEPGFIDAIRNIKILVNQMGTDLKVIGVTDRLQILKGIISKAEPTVKTEYIEIPNWLKLIEKLDDLLNLKSLFILMSAREGTISWRPGLDRLPGLIANRFPKNNFMTIFPSEMASEHLDSDFKVAQCVTESAILIRTESTSDHRALIQEMLDQKFGENDALKSSMLNALLDNSLDYTPEIIPGVSIYDTHTDLVQETCVLITVNSAGIKIPKTSGPSNILVLVINPDSLGSDVHFNRLNEVARIFKNPNVIADLKDAQAPEKVIKLLQDTMKSGKKEKSLTETAVNPDK
jgi:mannitol/fructose-specific phosphotransferase system IIA component (Ntr-type)